MPNPKSWLPRCGEILKVLNGMEAAALDRSQVEAVFELQRRQAINLMSRLAPAEHGKAAVVQRKDLISYVAYVEQTEGASELRRQTVRRDLDRELEERRAVRQMVEAEGRRVVQFPVTDQILCSTISGLPPGTEIVPGRITLQFDPNDPATACQILYQLAMALLNDYPGFERVQRPDRPTPNQLLDSLETERLGGVLSIR